MAFNESDWLLTPSPNSTVLEDIGVVDSDGNATGALPLSSAQTSSQLVQSTTDTNDTVELLRSGLNVTRTKIGFYDGTEWKSYMNSTGCLHSNVGDTTSTIGGYVYDGEIVPDGQIHLYRSGKEKISIGKSLNNNNDDCEIKVDSDLKNSFFTENNAYYGVAYSATCSGDYGTGFQSYSESSSGIGFKSLGGNVGVSVESPSTVGVDISCQYTGINVSAGISANLNYQNTSYSTVDRQFPSWTDQQSQPKGGLNFDNNGKFYYCDGTRWNKVVSVNVNNYEIADQPMNFQYPINIESKSDTGCVEVAFNIIGLAGHGCELKIWYSNGMSNTLALSNPDNLSGIRGVFRVDLVGTMKRKVITATYSYSKTNGESYNEILSDYLSISDQISAIEFLSSASTVAALKIRYL